MVPTTYLVDTTLSDASDYDQTVHAVRLPLTRSTAPRPEGGPPFPRAGARRPLRTPVGDVRQLCGGERD
ncbi:hypothetical protein B6J71_03610 [Klebsiella quasipneumoniae]|nr:hypothetical protein B6J71_03610 [Klebsiella quasipneumoniae]